jgi:cytochrome o ubiquinol oxidase subunit IV
MAEHTVALKRQVVNYLVGFVSALILSLAAFWLVTSKLVDGGWLIAALISLAVVQLVVQLVFFLHVGSESRPRWNLAALLFMLVMLVVIVAGSLWIMNNLNYNMMMTPEQMEDYMKIQREKGF